jgi:hypothetical protein
MTSPGARRITAIVAAVGAVASVVWASTGDASVSRLVGGLGVLGVVGATCTGDARMRAALCGTAVVLVVSAPGVDVPEVWMRLLVWLVVTIAVTTAVGGSATATANPDESVAHDEALLALVPWGLRVMTLGGLYACLPENGHTRAVGVALVLGAVATVASGSPVVARGAAAMGDGLLGWAVLFGGVYRGSAVVGGVACFGLLVAVPAAVRIVRGLGGRVGRPAAVVLVIGAQGGWALAVSRTAGIATSAGRAGAIAAAAVVLGAVVIEAALAALRPGRVR